MEWIKCSERMPGHCEYVLGFYRESNCSKCKRNGTFFTASCGEHWRIQMLKYDDWGWWLIIGEDGETSEYEVKVPDYWISEESLVPESLKSDIKCCEENNWMPLPPAPSQPPK